MKPEKTILEESIDRISRTDPDEFKIWLKSFLINNIAYPLPDYSFTEYPYEYLYRIYESTKNVLFQERLRRAVKELFRDWNINAVNTENIEYYSSLINLIAELPVSEMYPDLIEIALKGYYRGILSENEKKLDIQTLILQVIAGFPPSGEEKLKDRLMDLVKKYIPEMKYTPLCFRIAWQTRYESAIQYIRPLLECSKIRKFDIYGTIKRFLLGCGVGKLKDLLVPMLQELKLHDMREYFLKILLEVGAEIRVSNFYFDFKNHLLIWERTLLLRWELYEKPESQIEISCDDDEIMDYIEEFNQFGVENQENKDKKFLKRIEEFDPQPSNSRVLEQTV